MSIRTTTLGGTHGTDFDIQTVRSIGFRATDMIEAVLLNGVRHGDNQGRETDVLELQQDEYINELVVYESHDTKKDEHRVRGVTLTTSLNRSLTAGTLRGPSRTLKNMRIIGLGGNSGHMLFNLRVRHITDYVESKKIPGDWAAVINVIPQGQTFESFQSSRVAKMNASRLFLETVTSVQQTTEGGAAIGEFSAKASTTFGLSVTTQTEFNEQIESETVESERITYAPPAGHVGLEVVTMEVFEAHDGTIWFFPITEPSIVSAPVSGDAVIREPLYDMTGTLTLHLPYMADQAYGFERFKALEAA
ncbi:MAG: jacalin-like lectin [Pseudomonadota bacterium]